MVTSLAFSPDGKTLMSGSLDKTIRLWDTSTRNAIGEPLRGHEESIGSIAFSPDGKTLASASGDKTIRLWDTSTWKASGEPLRGHEETIGSIAFSPDGKTLMSGSGDKLLIRVWDIVNHRLLGEPLRGHEQAITSVAFSPDGKTLASASKDKTIRLWDTSTWKASGEPLRGHEERVWSLAFSPDGKTLASASNDKTIRLWDTSTWKAIGEPLRGHDREVTSVAFSPDGKTLASASYDGTSESYDHTIRLWYAVPLRDRISQIRASLAMSAEVRVILTSQLPTLGTDRTAVTELQESVLADPRFTGDLRRTALIVVGEVDLARQDETDRLVGEFEVAYGQKPKDWSLVLQRLAKCVPEEIGYSPAFWSEVAWAGLTELPPDSPARDLKLLLKYAERAVKLWSRPDRDILKSLARAHWELGDKAKAIQVQREAVTASATARETYADDQGKAMQADIEATLKLYESLPAGAALPKEPTPDTPTPTPNP